LAPNGAEWEKVVADFSDLPIALAGKRVLPTKKACSFVGVSPTEWDRLRALGATPAPVKLGIRKLGCTVESLVGWIQARQQSAA
jgi:predicted DNA-binding transcriptional regulator AlpA